MRKRLPLAALLLTLATLTVQADDRPAGWYETTCYVRFTTFKCWRWHGPTDERGQPNTGGSR